MSDEIEAAWVDITIEKVHYLICIVYRPPSAQSEYNENILNMLDKVDAEEKCNFIMGDLNFDYKLDESLSSNPLYYIENAYGYTQMITEITRKTTNTESIIDVLLTSNPEFYTNADRVKYALSYHYLIQTVITIPCNKACQFSQIHNEVTYRDFKQYSTNFFTEDIKDTYEQFVSPDTGITWDVWNNTSLGICYTHVPLIKARLKARKNPCIPQIL